MDERVMVILVSLWRTTAIRQVIEELPKENPSINLHDSALFF